MLVEKEKLITQLKYLPMQDINWGKDIKPYYKKFGNLLNLYNYQLAPDDNTIKNFLKDVLSKVNYSLNSEDDTMFISDVYYFIIHWQKDLKFSLDKTLISLKKFKDWWMMIGIAIIDFGSILGMIYLGILVWKIISG